MSGSEDKAGTCDSVGVRHGWAIPHTVQAARQVGEFRGLKRLGACASPTPPCFCRKNPRISAAFSVAGQSPKSPGSERVAPERAVFGSRPGSASASLCARTAETCASRRGPPAGRSFAAYKGGVGKGSSSQNSLGARPWLRAAARRRSASGCLSSPFHREVGTQCALPSPVSLARRGQGAEPDFLWLIRQALPHLPCGQTLAPARLGA